VVQQHWLPNQSVRAFRILPIAFAAFTVRHEPMSDMAIDAGLAREIPFFAARFSLVFQVRPKTFGSGIVVLP
jgi:hypothetical protein